MSFYYKSPDRVEKDLSEDTLVLCHELDSEGNSKTILKTMDSLLEPLSLLSFTDFQLSEMIKNGVSYSSLNISNDMRIGHEQELIALEERFKSLESQIFQNVEQSKN